ncbi:hypothetical protein HNR19_000007 [Nocardioides thalensis]|uniref:Uncharacterized protein n=1 Tax=Nocardioides thalensis TaxID=1914755 RepID=A0A853BVJ5_9ACTN|nr:hypothetical protein [Nocardioides thalensis]NYI99308.1 hypothetical protein [Nocardioides thalensis]
MTAKENIGATGRGECNFRLRIGQSRPSDCEVVLSPIKRSNVTREAIQEADGLGGHTRCEICVGDTPKFVEAWWDCGAFLKPKRFFVALQSRSDVTSGDRDQGEVAEARKAVHRRSSGGENL